MNKKGGTRWSNEDDEKLFKLFKQNKKCNEISNELERTEWAIECRLLNYFICNGITEEQELFQKTNIDISKIKKFLDQKETRKNKVDSSPSIDIFKNKISNIENRISNVENRLSNIENILSNIENKISNIKKGL